MASVVSSLCEIFYLNFKLIKCRACELFVNTCLVFFNYRNKCSVHMELSHSDKYKLKTKNLYYLTDHRPSKWVVLKILILMVYLREDHKTEDLVAKTSDEDGLNLKCKELIKKEKIKVLTILDSTEDGKDFLSLADLDSNWLEDVNTKLDQYKLNLQIEKFNKIDLNQNGATTAQIQTNKMAANQTMTTWLPDKMAANQTRTTWLPDVNNVDRFENPLEHTKNIIY